MRQLEIDALVATWTDFCATASLLLGSVDCEHYEPRHTMHTSAPKNHNPGWHDPKHTFLIEREPSSPALNGQLLRIFRSAQPGESCYGIGVGP